MRKVSEFHQARTFGFDWRQSRVRKCAAIIEKLTPGVFLDIGCAHGDWAAFWAELGWQCYGVDINSDCVEAAVRKGVRAMVCDMSSGSLPFPDGFADLVFAGEVIEHLVDTDGFLQEVHRCLKPGGHFLLTTPNLASFENRVRLLLGCYPMWVDYRLAEAGHIRAYTPGVLTKQLRTDGFSIVKHTGNWVPFIPQKYLDDIKLPALSVTGTLLPWLAMDIIILARKDL